MQVMDYGGNGMCGPRCVLRTYDETQASKYYIYLLEWAKKNRRKLSNLIVQEHFNQGKDPSFFLDALKTKDSLTVYFGDGGSTTSFFMVLAAFERQECYTIIEESFGSIMVNIKAKVNRIFKGSNGHWVELIVKK